MARRKFLKIQDQQELFGVPTDEDSLIRHYTLSPSDRLEIEVRRRKHNQLGFAVQLCMMRHPGRALMVHEIPPRAMLNYIAEQLDADPESFRSYARREETRREHIAHLLSYFGKRTATAQDRRAALLSAVETATATDKGHSIAQAIVTTLRERKVLLPAPDTIERIGFAGRVIARRRVASAQMV